MASKKKQQALSQELPDTIEGSHALIKSLRVELATATSVNDQLQKVANEKPSTPVGGHGTVKVNGVDYLVRFPAVTLKGRKITAEEVKKDKKLAEELVKINSGMLKKVS